MTWTCTTCGLEADAASPSVLVRIGWHITGTDDGLCPPCAKKGRLDEGTAKPLSDVDRQMATRINVARARKYGSA